MKELIVMLGTMMPEEQILDELKSALMMYELEKTPENRGRIVFHMQLFLAKELTQGKPENLGRIMQKMKEFDDTQDLLNPNKQ